MSDKDDIVERIEEYISTHNVPFLFVKALNRIQSDAKRIAELEAEVERYRNKELREAHAEKVRDWNTRRLYASKRWISADQARIHREAQKRGWKGGEPAEPYVPKELVDKIQRVYGYLKCRADRDFLRANPKPVLEPTP